MGSEISQEDYNRAALELYEASLRNTCVLPDVGIDESLLKYSGTDSNAVLQSYSNEMANRVPGFIASLGTALAPMTFNAVGLGALVISMIIEISMKSATQTSSLYETYSLLRRVFGEEKASTVRDTMTEYLKRHRTYMNDDERLPEEIGRLEAQLSNHLTILRNSLLHDRQMSSRGFKIWVNGASFHLQMVIHEARLNVQTGKPASDYVRAIEAFIDVYLQDLDHLLEKYKTHKTVSTTRLSNARQCFGSLGGGCAPSRCIIKNHETGCEIDHGEKHESLCESLTETYKKLIFSKYEPITGLKSHFSTIKNNLLLLINQHGSFSLPGISSAG